jgi:hypothetical protein
MSMEYTYFACTMASGGVLSSEVDLSYGWRHAYLEIPVLASNATHHIQAAATSGGTYRRVMYAPYAQSMVSLLSNVYSVHSSVTNAMVPIPAGLRYVKVETTVSMAGGVDYRFICGE